MAVVDPQLKQHLRRSLGRGVYLLEPGVRAQLEKRLKALGLTPPAEVMKAEEEAAWRPAEQSWALPAPLEEGPPGELRERAAAARAAAGHR